jgi:hypothetical protein
LGSYNSTDAAACRVYTFGGPSFEQLQFNGSSCSQGSHIWGPPFAKSFGQLPLNRSSCLQDSHIWGTARLQDFFQVLSSSCRLGHTVATVKRLLLIDASRGVWEGVAVDSLKFRSGPPCLTVLGPAGGPPLKQPYGHFRCDPRATSTYLDTPRRTPMDASSSIVKNRC